MLRTSIILSLALAAEAFTSFPAFSATPSPMASRGVSASARRGGRVGRPALVALRGSATEMSTQGSERRPQPGDLGASELVNWLWNEAQFMEDYPECSMPFFADDVVYEDMIYKDPFVGRPAVEAMLRNVKEICPPDFVFVMDRCSDGKRACGFTWHIELKDRPQAGKFANGGSYYELNEEGKIVYVRDLVEPTIKTGDFVLRLVGVLAKIFGGPSNKK